MPPRELPLSQFLNDRLGERATFRRCPREFVQESVKHRPCQESGDYVPDWVVGLIREPDPVFPAVGPR